MEVDLGDTLELKKPHPCGSNNWEVVGLGADIGIRCLKCHRRVRVGREVLRRRVRGIQKAKAEK